MGSHFEEENQAIFQPIRYSGKRVGKICLSLSEKGGEKVAASVTAKVSEISDTSTDGLGVSC